MEKRALLAIIISLIILVLYQQYFAPPAPQPAKEKPEATAQPPAPGKESVPKGEAVPPVAAPAPALKAQPGKDIVIDTPLYTAVFDTRGARLKSWKVKKYLDKIEEGAKPLDLAKGELGKELPFGLEIQEANFPFSADVPYEVNTDELILGPQQERGEVRFTRRSPEGLQVVQQFTFHADSYRMGIQLQLANPSANAYEGRPMYVWAGKIPAASGGGGMACIPGSSTDSSSGVPPFSALVKKELQEIEFSDVKDEKRFSQNVQWAGFQDKYFLAALIPQKIEGTELIYKRVSETAGDMRLAGPKIALAPQTQHVQNYAMYLGPKDLDLLKAFGSDLDRALDFGWFDIVAKPMLYVLKFFYQYTGNYGIAIILLTIIIKILFWYPTHISYKSMKEMKKLQPEMAKLREKFKDEKEKLNKEMMDLYRRYKVNPMSGCLPMVIQIPVFFALYKVLLYSIEIRHAPFYWWIRDLSAMDPYYISPILMGASMFIQQWMTPTTGDPTQAKMMLIMPVVFTFMFLTFPTGLVIYWLFNNLLSIGQQIYINRQTT